MARLAELDVLRNVEVLSCVSGGSIVGACYWLALRKRLENPETAGQVDYIEMVHFLIDHFERAVAADLRDQVQLSTPTIAWHILLGAKGAMDPQRTASALEKHFYRPLLPGDGPLFMHDLAFTPADHNPATAGATVFNPTEATGGGPGFRLYHFFDYVAGTSTGAIIAAGLARGMSAEELLNFYQDTGPAMFDKQFILKRWHALYKSEPLKKELQKTFGAETTLKPDDLECLLLAVTRNRTTDSPWPISSNPQAKYNDTLRPDCNLIIPLWQIVRASTAASVFFPPEVIQWDPADESKAFVFVDGGLTPYNNPAFLLYRMATEPGYRLNWASGEDKLLVMSVGTGAAAAVEDGVEDPSLGLIENVAALPSALMYAAMVDQDTSCRFVGRCVHGAVLDREIGDMTPHDSGGNKIPQCLDRQPLHEGGPPPMPLNLPAGIL